jgi:hypothetical protein
MPRKKSFGYREEEEISPKGPKDATGYLKLNLQVLCVGQTLKVCRSHGDPALKIAKRLKIGIRLEEMTDARGDRGILITRLPGAVSEPLGTGPAVSDPSTRGFLARYEQLPKRSAVEVRPCLQPGQPEAHVVCYKGSNNTGKVNLKATFAGLAAGQAVTVRIPSGMDLPRIKTTAANAKVRIRIGEHPAANTVVVTSLGPWRPKMKSSTPVKPRERCFQSWTAPKPAVPDIFS